MALGKICSTCKSIFTGASCPKPDCRRASTKSWTPRRRRNHAVYRTAAHKRQRLRVFARDEFRCVDGCGFVDETRTGRGLIADHVAGIDEVREFGDDELATRCFVCSGRKDGGRGRG